MYVPGAGDVDVLEVDRLGGALDEVDGGVRAVDDVGVGHVDRGVDPLVEAGEPDRADAEAPVVVVVAGPDQGVPGDRVGAGDRRALAGVDARIAVGDVDAAAVGQGVGDHVVGDLDVPAAVGDDVVGQDRRDHRVEAEGVVDVRHPVGPHGQAVVTGVADEGVGHRRVRHAGVEVHAVGDLVDDPAVA